VYVFTIEEIPYIIKHKASVDKATKGGWTALHLALLCGLLDIA
jgi:ankyrin repeat protein